MELESWSERKQVFCGWGFRRVDRDRPQLEWERRGLQSAGLEMGSSAGCCELSPSIQGETFLEGLSANRLLKWLCSTEQLFNYVRRCMHFTWRDAVLVHKCIHWPLVCSTMGPLCVCAAATPTHMYSINVESNRKRVSVRSCWKQGLPAPPPPQVPPVLESVSHYQSLCRRSSIRLKPK